MAAIKIYASDLYGGTLWKLDELPAQQVMNSWFTTVKDVWGVTRATHTATARWLACENRSFQEDLLARRAKYFPSMLSSASPEVTTYSRIAATYVRTTTAANSTMLTNLGLDPFTVKQKEVRQKLKEEEPVETLC